MGSYYARPLVLGLTVISAVAMVLGLSIPVASGAALRWHAVGVHSPSGGSYGILSGVACSGPTSCVAGGDFYSKARTTEAMIVASSRHSWSTARAVRLPANALPLGEGAAVASIDCPARASCVAVGFYTTKAGLQAFTTAGHGSSWARATVPSLPKDSARPAVAFLSGLSCTGRGSCVAVGGYTNRGGHGEPLVATETRGRWRRSIGIGLPANAAISPQAHLSAVSCPKAGDCVAVGGYQTKSSQGEGMAAIESKGHWSRPRELRLPANVSAGPGAEMYSVSCGSTRTCVAVGSYVTRSGISAALAVTESGGRWRQGKDLTALPANAATGSAGYADLNGISCTGNSCMAVGQYRDKQGGQLALAVSESGGKWARATAVSPPSRAAGGASQQATLFAVACQTSIRCTAVGDYTSSSHVGEAMAATALG